MLGWVLALLGSVRSWPPSWPSWSAACCSGRCSSGSHGTCSTSAHAVGAGELGFWGLVLVALFLAVGLAGRVIIVAVVFLIDPAWLHRSATLHWPAPTLQELRRDLPAPHRRERLGAPAQAAAASGARETPA